MENDRELFEIYAGTYEEFMLGFKFYKHKDNEYTLKQTVADHAHKGSIRAISSRGNLLATGGFDEIIHVYNLDENKEVGTLTQHTGTVTWLCFTSDEKHLISCSEDGTVAIIRIGSWIMEKIWAKAHKGSYVNCVSVHPSNKMAFSVGNDGYLRTWNLIEGKQAFATNISHLTKRPELVVWSPNGESYAVPHDCKISVFSTESASVKCSFQADSRITCAHFFKDETLFVGDMDGNLIQYELKSEGEVRKHQVTETRIKAITSHNEYIIAANSQGLVVVFEMANNGINELARNDSCCRITCISAACRCHRRDRKKKKSQVKSEIKNEASEPKIESEVKIKSNKKRKVKISEETLTPNSHKRKVECIPRRQSWIIEDQGI